MKEVSVSPSSPSLLTYPLPPSLKVIEAQNWTCYMCRDMPCVEMLTKREDWDLKLWELFDSNHEMEYVRLIV